MYNPVSTYRIQFNKDFNLKSFEKIIPYLKDLGIKTIYASPIFKAVSGSTHGYDVTDPHQINPEIGSVGHLKRIIKDLKKEGIGWIQDIVPNHMAFHPENTWLMDVLERGPQSKYCNYFDITWNSELYSGKLMVPFLGAPIAEIIDKGELKIAFEDSGFFLTYYENHYPIHIGSYAFILEQGDNELSESVTEIIEQINNIHRISNPDQYDKRLREIKKQLKALLKQDNFKSHLDSCLDAVNTNKAFLKQIIDQQVYQLCFWQETNYQINFRRFFTINGLICLNIQEKEVFEDYHKLISELLHEGMDGVRVDHVDGMYNPTKYLNDLRNLTGPDKYICVEKILEKDEELPEWPIEGTTGYEFLSAANNVFSDKKQLTKLTDYYYKLTNDSRKISERIIEKKENILYNRLAGELVNLKDLFLELGLAKDEDLEQIGEEGIKSVIAHILIHCPVYRYYGNEVPLSKYDQKQFNNLLQDVKDKFPDQKGAVKLFQKIFLKNIQKEDKDYQQRALHFYHRLMQFTGPLMAKGVEDTLMYTYSRFIGHNEVGDSPTFTGLTIDEFHDQMIRRHNQWSLSMNATSTHDTKRGEDVRARLNVLTSMIPEWTEKVEEWRKINQTVKSENIPDNNDEYFIYQTIVGAHPMPGEKDNDFTDRLAEYFEKALREAKRHSNWTEPDEFYEKRTIEFVKNILKEGSEFRKSLDPFLQSIIDTAILNSLAQVVLKYTCPGIPDLYQGTELFDLSLVDPDNRRPVDYKLRTKFLNGSAEENDIHNLWNNRFDGKIKLWLTHQLLKLREKHPELLSSGEYLPVKVKGAHADKVVAYLRKHENEWMLVALPLNLFVNNTDKQGTLDLDWEDTYLKLPKNSPHAWNSALGENVEIDGRKLKLNGLSMSFPLIILTSQTLDHKERAAGILAHITSLPSSFGIGDLGNEAYAFADFLIQSSQTYWQILPLNPTGKGQSYSPYSSDSSMAGNVLLISPEKLFEEGFLSKKDLDNATTKSKNHKVDFEHADTVKTILFEKAYKKFKKEKNLQIAFKEFIKEQDHWLDDYAIYQSLKRQHGNKPWFEWVEEFKNRNEKALKSFKAKNQEAIQKIKFLQFLFYRQWQALKLYCNSKGLQLFGDLPFYISHDSVDVWTNPQIFKLDKKGKMKGVAGVPPDYFNEDGQLWGMPVFDWKQLKKEDYSWWTKRLQKNMEFFDLLRLDHFRAFAGYWEVPAGETTARKGKWKKGPGKHLFKAVSKSLGDLNFIAEDLGEITDDVYSLRDKYDFPGMKVLQFAFGDDIPGSPHIPHNFNSNFVVYTGTHDNNTTLGWYRKDAGKNEKENITNYCGVRITQRNVNKELIRLAYSSTAKIAIIPMQDVLGLNEKHRMNKPATISKNWEWQLAEDDIDNSTAEWLRNWVNLYNR